MTTYAFPPSVTSPRGHFHPDRTPAAHWNLHTRREPRVRELPDPLPDLLYRLSDLDIESPVFIGAGRGPCYVPDRMGNDTYVNAYDSDYDFG